jgi:GntR family transcriptional repressor for pyruvate dehydrogenase complex
MSETGKAMFPRVVREPRLSDKVADLLLQTILSTGLQAGDRLPSERELAEQFGVSRTVIREAVRALAAKGVIDVRTGSGLRVAAVDGSTVSESMSLYLRGGSLEYPKVHEVRKTLEVEIAGLAAERSTAEDIAALGKICDRMEELVKTDVEAASRLDLEFHRAIATATNNDLYLLLLDSIGEALLEVRRDNLKQPPAVKEALASHRLILGGIAARDRSGARRAMSEHLDHVERHWRSTHRSDGAPA